VPIPKLITRGLLFMWADKENLHAIVQLAEQWRFRCAPQTLPGPSPGKSAHRESAYSLAECVCVCWGGV
jgi:hypothetical protein